MLWGRPSTRFSMYFGCYFPDVFGVVFGVVFGAVFWSFGDWSTSHVRVGGRLACVVFTVCHTLVSPFIPLISLPPPEYASSYRGDADFTHHGRPPVRQLGAHFLFVFLTLMVGECDTLSMSEAQALLLLPTFLTGTASGQSSAARNTYRSSTRCITCWPEARQYFPRKYATPEAIEKSVLGV